MQKKSLLGGAAVGVLLAFSASFAAHAAPAATSNADVKAELDQLKSEIQSLEAWRDQEAAHSQQTEQQLQEVKGQLADANARAAAAEAQVAQQIQTLPTEVDAEVAKVKPKPNWSDNTSISGRMYYDISNIDEKSNVGNPGLNLGSASSTPPSGNQGHSPNGTGFDIKRFYVSVDHTFNGVFSADVTTDFLYDYSTKSTQLYLKKAYLQAKASDAFIVRLGAADLPWIPFAEDVYGYRYVENTLIDRTKFGTSSDWGVQALGKFPVGPASVGYDFAVINGLGYKTPGFLGGANRTEGLDFEGRVNVNYKGFVAAIGGYDGKLGQDYSGVTTFHNATRFDAILAYSDKWFKLGGEYMWANADVASSQITLNPLTAPADNSDAYSIFGNINFTPQISVFGRYDWVKPRETTLNALTNTYYNIGISYEPVKVVDFALVYKRDQIDDGAFATQNFATTSANGRGYYDEIGLWGQFRW